MQAAALLSKNSSPTKDEVVAHMDGNLCRCMTYARIQRAVLRAAAEMRTASTGNDRRNT
jgi:isoquinoline 1-oxidoreductase alpha subunit